MSGMSWRRIAHWGGRLLLMGLVALIAFAVGVLTVLPRATHAQALTVLTGSMTPKIPVGSVVLVRPVDPGTLHVGDIATYQKTPGKPEYITHRIVKIDASRTPTMFTFKGDANRGDDVNPVPANAIRGKVWFHVPYLGALRDMMRTRGGLAGVAVILLIAYAAAQARAAMHDRRETSTTEPECATVDTGALVAILATLPLAAFDGLSARAVSKLLRGSLLDESETFFTVLLPDRAERADETRALLESFGAVRIQTSVAASAEPFDVLPAPAPQLVLVSHSRDAA